MNHPIYILNAIKSVGGAIDSKILAILINHSKYN
jgi:hypothetical protein